MLKSIFICNQFLTVTAVMAIAEFHTSSDTFDKIVKLFFLYKSYKVIKLNISAKATKDERCL